MSWVVGRWLFDVFDLSWGLEFRLVGSSLGCRQAASTVRRRPSLPPCCQPEDGACCSSVAILGELVLCFLRLLFLNPITSLSQQILGSSEGPASYIEGIRCCTCSVSACSHCPTLQGFPESNCASFTIVGMAEAGKRATRAPTSC